MSQSNRSDKEFTQPRRIGHLFSQHNLGSIYLSSTLELLHLLTKLGIKPKQDGWRKYATAYLRTEDSRFLLATFRLKIGLTTLDDTHVLTRQWIIEQLAHFFKTHPRLWNTRLKWQRRSANIQQNEHLDMVWAEFDASGNLSRLRTFFDADKGLSFEDSAQPYADFFIQAYNKTRLAGRQRPYDLLMAIRYMVKNTLDEKAGIEFAQRILDSVFIHFENVASDRRLEFPDFSVFPHPGGGAFNILCRLQPSGYHEADLWFHVNHALQDGNPVLEAIQELRTMCGTSGAMLLPPPSHNRESFTFVQPAHHDSGREVAYTYQYLSFERLLHERERLNKKYSHLLKSKITITGMVIWGLGNQPAFRDTKLTTIVDVPENPAADVPRTLGFITNNPNDFLDENDRELSCIRYQIAINDAIEAARKREDITYAALKSQALAPITSYEMTLSLVPQAVHDIGGKVSLTLMPLADFCTPPADDTKEAVIAIGNFMMPTEDGKLAGVVCIKSVKDKARPYWESVYDTITQWRA